MTHIVQFDPIDFQLLDQCFPTRVPGNIWVLLRSLWVSWDFLKDNWYSVFKLLLLRGWLNLINPLNKLFELVYRDKMIPGQYLISKINIFPGFLIAALYQLWLRRLEEPYHSTLKCGHNNYHIIIPKQDLNLGLRVSFYWIWNWCSKQFGHHG